MRPRPGEELVEPDIPIPALRFAGRLEDGHQGHGVAPAEAVVLLEPGDDLAGPRDGIWVAGIS
ncbi:MAG: hypothetical protein WKF80_10965 [Thermomicrobiales bacterium]